VQGLEVEAIAGVEDHHRLLAAGRQGDAPLGV